MPSASLVVRGTKVFWNTMNFSRTHRVTYDFFKILNGSLFYSKEKQEFKKKIEFLPRIFSIYRNMGNRATLKRKKKKRLKI